MEFSAKTGGNSPAVGGMAVIIAALLIAALGFIVYANSLGGKFVYDDEYLVKDNAYIKSLSRLPKVFTEDVGSGADRSYSFYRPVAMITYALDYSIWRLNTTGYHLTNAILHILAALSVYWLINILFANNILSLGTALLFVVHPAHTEAVSYISGRSDPLALIFLLVSFIFYIKLSGKEDTASYAVMAVSYALALLTRENSMILPLLIMVYHFTLRRKVNLRPFLVILLSALIYITIRATLLRFIHTKAIVDMTILQRLPGSFAAIANYARLLILPFDLRMEYGYIKTSFLDSKVIAGMAIFGGSIFYALKRWKDQDRIIPFAILWFFIALLPVLNIYPINAYMAEHWLYLPSIGFFLLAAKGISLLYGTKNMKIAAVAIFAAILIFFSCLTIGQNNYWKEPIGFYLRTLKYSPNNFGFYTNLGREYAAARNFEQAIACYKKAIEIEPRLSFPYNNIGNIYLDMGRQEEAIPYYKKTMELAPNYAFPYNNLGNVYLSTGRPLDAIPFYKKAAQLAPNSAYIRNNIGRASFNAGLIDEAEAAYKEALDIDTNCLFAHTNLGELYLLKGEDAKARSEFETAIKMDPNYAPSYMGMSVVNYRAKDHPAALKYFDKAISLGAKPDEAFAKIIEGYRK
jgi:tetratricopeptide (TPR) repeat protein